MAVTELVQELEEKIQQGSDHKDCIGPAKECELYPLEMGFKQIIKCSGGTESEGAFYYLVIIQSTQGFWTDSSHCTFYLEITCTSYDFPTMTT